jgi:hypothetical protein
VDGLRKALQHTATAATPGAAAMPPVPSLDDGRDDAATAHGAAAAAAVPSLTLAMRGSRSPPRRAAALDDDSELDSQATVLQPASPVADSQATVPQSPSPVTSLWGIRYPPAALASAGRRASKKHKSES